MAASQVKRVGNRIDLFVNNKWYYYDLLSSKIGEGAMGDVYEGYSFDGSEHVAIKCIKKEYANNPDIRNRAAMEASLMFRHKNLIEMIGYCSLHANHGPIWIISKFVAGQNIDDYIKGFKNSPNRVRQICNMIFPVMDALSYIHSKNIVHMDIKPSNIMVENGCNVRLMDLGIAYADKNIKLSASTSNSLVGTPKYAAPEQFAQAVQGVSLNSSTDIFELGVTLYELLTGYNPFNSNSIADAINKRKSVLLPYVQDVPSNVIDILRKATTYNQNDRFQSVVEMKTALSLALNEPKKNENKWIITLIACIASGVVLILIIYHIFRAWNS